MIQHPVAELIQPYEHAWQRDVVTGDEYVNIPEVCGASWWAMGHAWAQSIRDAGCPSCGGFAVEAMEALHDLVNVKLQAEGQDKIIRNPDNLARFALLYHSAVHHAGIACPLCREAGAIEAESAQEGRAEQPPPFGWPGGKRDLARRIAGILPPHRTYVEPFCGAAAVFWAKEPAEVEVLSDLDPDVARFYRELPKISSCNLRELAKDFDWLLRKRGRQTPCEFLANVLCSYGTKRDHKADRVTCRKNAPRFHARLETYQERIRGVKVLNQDWLKVVGKFDAPDTVFYFDPPYHETAQSGLHEDQLDRLGEELPKLKGKWILSYNDHPDVLAAFAEFNVVRVPVRTTISQQAHEPRVELLISNFKIRAKRTSKAKLCQEEPGLGRRLLDEIGSNIIAGIGFGIGAAVLSRVIEGPVLAGVPQFQVVNFPKELLDLPRQSFETVEFGADFDGYTEFFEGQEPRGFLEAGPGNLASVGVFPRGRSIDEPGEAVLVGLWSWEAGAEIIERLAGLDEDTVVRVSALLRRLAGTARQGQSGEAGGFHLSPAVIKLDAGGEGEFIRERVADPGEFDEGSFRTLTPDESQASGRTHRLVVGCRKGEWNPDAQPEERCRTGVVLQAILHPRSEQSLLVREALDWGVPVEGLMDSIEAAASLPIGEVDLDEDRDVVVFNPADDSGVKAFREEQPMNVEITA